MPNVITDTQEIERLVSDAVAHGIARALPEAVRRATWKSRLTEEEVRALTGWGSRKLRHLRVTKQLTFEQHGRKIVYPADALEAFLIRHRVTARP